MRNIWLVAKHEYLRTVRRRAFILGTIAVPVFAGVIMVVTILIATRGQNKLPVGYVDHAGVLELSLAQTLPDADKRIGIEAYPDEEAARAALENDQIQAYFVFPAQYPDLLETDVYYLTERPSGEVWREFDDFVRANLTSGLPTDVQERLLEGPTFTVEDISSGRTFGEESIASVVLPFVASFFFLFATMAAAGYMLQVVADEKESRTVEIMVTTVTPNQLVGGKAIGLLGAALSQLAIYIVAAVIAIRLAAPYVPELQALGVPWDYLGLMALFFVPAYILISGIMIAIGGAVTEFQQGQQVAGMLNLLFIAPIIITPVLFSNPNSPLVVAMTLFPPTAFLTVSLRWGLGTIPMWQLLLSWLLLVTSAVFMIWAAARIFRTGMLRYGQAMSFRGALAAIRGE